MHFNTITILSLATAAVTASPTLLPRADPIWYLRSIQRSCNENATPATCDYTYGIDENNGAAPFVCNYTITAPTTDPATPAAHTNYQQQQCAGTDRYKINAGWDASGFTTIVVSDYAADVNKWAFFGVADTQYVDGQAVTPDPQGQSAQIGVFPASVKVRVAQ